MQRKSEVEKAAAIRGIELSLPITLQARDHHESSVQKKTDDRSNAGIDNSRAAWAQELLRHGNKYLDRNGDGVRADSKSQQGWAGAFASPSPAMP